MAPRKRLGEMLIEAGIIDQNQLKAALGHQRQWGVRIGQALVDLKFATEADIVRAIASKCGVEIARIGAVDPGALRQAVPLLPREFAVRYNVLPIAADAASITVAMSDPSNLAIVDEVQFRTGRRVKVCVGGDREVAEAVNRQYPGDGPVEAIALDLDVDDTGPETMFDPFGGGSKDALEAFFGSGPDARAREPGTAATAPATRAGAQPAARPGTVAPAGPAAAPRGGPAPGTRAPAPSAAPSPAAGPAARPGAAPAPAVSPVPAPAPAAAPVPAPAQATRPGPAHAPAARPAPAAAHAPAPWTPPSAISSRPAPAPGGGRGLALDLEDGPSPQPWVPRPAAGSPAPGGGSPKPFVKEPTPSGEPILATEFAVDDAGAGARSRELTPQEIAILDALERLAGGAHAEPDIVKPAQAMAAVIRLLLRKRIVTELEFLDELARK